MNSLSLTVARVSVAITPVLESGKTPMRKKMMKSIADYINTLPPPVPRCTMRRLPSAQCAREPSAIEFAMDQPARMGRVNFEERYIVQVEALTMFTTARENLPLPSPKYLKIHTTCCRVAHTSGVAAYYHNADDHDVLVAQAGSRNPVESDPLAAL